MGFGILKGLQGLLGGGKKGSGTQRSGGDALSSGGLSDSLVDPLEEEIDAGLKKLKLDEALAEYRGPLRRIGDARMVSEQLDYLEAIESGKLDHRALYELFVMNDADKQVNIVNRLEFDALAREGRYDEMDFESVTQTVRADLQESVSLLVEDKVARAKMRSTLEASSKSGSTSSTKGSTDKRGGSGGKATPAKAKPLSGVGLALNKAFNTEAYKAHLEAEERQQAQLQAAELRIAELKQKANARAQAALQKLSVGEWLQPPFRAILYRAAVVEHATENIDFVEGVAGGTMSNRTLFETFIPRRAPRSVNIGKPVREPLEALAGQAAWGQMDFTDAVVEVEKFAITDLTMRIATDGSSADGVYVDAMRAMRAKMGIPE